MKKILLLILILIVSYFIAVFLVPEKMDSFAEIIGVGEINNSLRNGKETLNNTAKNFPNSEEISEKIDSAAAEVDNIRNTVTSGIQGTKEAIDTVRATLSGAEDTYNKAKDVIQETGETIDNIKQGINDLEKVGETIKGAVDTGIEDKS